MAETPFDTGGPTYKRRPALKGIAMLDVSNGQERVRAWPTKRGKPKTENQKELQRRFRLANEACKYWDPRNIASINLLRAGTPILIRDVQIMMMYNRFASFTLPDGRTIYPVEARQDVSGALDLISPIPGSLLFRTADGWRYIPPPDAANRALVSTGTEGATWSDRAPGGNWGEIDGLITDQADLMTFLERYALLADTLEKADNLNSLASKPTSRANLDVYSKSEVNGLIPSTPKGADLVPAWTPITWGASETRYGNTVYPSVETFTLTADERLEIDGFVHQLSSANMALFAGIDGTHALACWRGTDGKITLFTFNGSSASSTLSASGTNSNAVYTGKHRLKLIADVMNSTTSSCMVATDWTLCTRIQQTAVALVGTVKLWLLSDAPGKCEVFARVVT